MGGHDGWGAPSSNHGHASLARGRRARNEKERERERQNAALCSLVGSLRPPALRRLDGLARAPRPGCISLARAHCRDGVFLLEAAAQDAVTGA